MENRIKSIILQKTIINIRQLIHMDLRKMYVFGNPLKVWFSQCDHEFSIMIINDWLLSHFILIILENRLDIHMSWEKFKLFIKEENVSQFPVIIC